jgi:hypothetical protein
MAKISWEDSPEDSPVPIIPAAHRPEVEVGQSGQGGPIDVAPPPPSERERGDDHPIALPELVSEGDGLPKPTTLDGKPKVRRLGQIPRRSIQAVALLAACALSFGHGWAHGSQVTSLVGDQPTIDGAPSSKCGSGHCRVTRQGQLWKEIRP